LKKIAIVIMLLGMFINSVADEVSSAIQGKTYAIDGSFGQHDFMGADSAFDWAFTFFANDTTYQLRGNEPSMNDFFGWKVVDIPTPAAVFYMFALGSDVDGDGSQRFDWVILDPASKRVYKLAGATDEGNFRYSDPIEIDFTLSLMEGNFTVAFQTQARYSQMIMEMSNDETLIDNTNSTEWINDARGCFAGVVDQDTDKCDTLEFAGHSDWRYPTTEEMVELILSALDEGVQLNYINPFCAVMTTSDGYVMTENSNRPGTTFTNKPGNAGLRCIRDR